MGDHEESSLESLVLLTKKKDKEVKALTAALQKQQEKYSRLTRLYKIYGEDYVTFRKLVQSLLPSAQPLFDEIGTSKPVDEDALTEQLEAWRRELRKDDERRNSYELLSRLAFGASETIPEAPSPAPHFQLAHMESLNDVAAAGISMWQKLKRSAALEQAPLSILERWQQYEKNHSANGSSVAQAADDALGAVRTRVATCKADIRKSVERTERMRATLADAALVKTSPRSIVHPKIEELREARDVALKHYNDLLSKRESGSEASAQLSRLTEELTQLKEKVQTRIDEHTKELSVSDASAMILESEVLTMESELKNFSFLEEAASCQAQVDKKLETYRGVEELTTDVRGIERLIRSSQDQCSVLEEAIVQIEKCAGDDVVRNMPYLREVVVKFIEFTQRGDRMAATLLPVICTILGATAEEQARLEQKFPSTWLYLHQTMGQLT